MFQAILDDADKINVSEINSVLFTFKYKSLNYERTFTIRFLRENYVEEFLEKLEQSLEVATKQAEMIRNRFSDFE
jgi:hypothetical protein